MHNVLTHGAIREATGFPSNLQHHPMIDGNQAWTLDFLLSWVGKHIPAAATGKAFLQKFSTDIRQARIRYTMWLCETCAPAAQSEVEVHCYNKTVSAHGLTFLDAVACAIPLPAISYLKDVALNFEPWYKLFVAHLSNITQLLRKGMPFSHAFEIDA